MNIGLLRSGPGRAGPAGAAHRCRRPDPLRQQIDRIDYELCSTRPPAPRLGTGLP